MRVEVKNTSKRLTCQVLTCDRVTAIKYVDAMTEAEILNLAEYSEGDKVCVVITGGNPAVTIYKRTVR
jgi:organic radical activating enzyme